MRPITFISAAVVATFAAGGSALAAIPANGYLVFKESRVMSVTEVRSLGTGRVVASSPSSHGRDVGGDACEDPSYVFAGPRWKDFEEYKVNAASTPSYLNAAETVADVLASHDAWESPFVTDCRRPKGKSDYQATFGGVTSRTASLVGELTSDGKNVVSFQSLAGTICDGATACVVLSFRKKTILEADMALERDLTRYGFLDFWTTDDRTWFDDVGGRWAVSDVATHEFGHFAGLDHVNESPALTMYPFVHDGAQTLGLGDMLGMNARY
jgi:Matrixin